jgi:hypothetical protein
MFRGQIGDAINRVSMGGVKMVLYGGWDADQREGASG